MLMKRTLFVSLISVCCLYLYAETVESFPFGDMEQWTVRYIKESKLLGGQTKTLYCIAPTDTIRENCPYEYGKTGSPWGSSNVYANVIGIEKAAITVTPEPRKEGGTCCRLDVSMLDVQVFGVIDIQVLAAGTLFTGRTIEPITTAKDPYQNIDFGVPFTKRPTAVIYDYKAEISDEEWVWYAKGMAKPKKQQGIHDEAEAYVYLQHRWEDEKGNVHAIRVGTGYERITQSQPTWVNDHRLPIHYGDITTEPWYQPYMGLNRNMRTMNSKGKIVPIQEKGWDATLEPTHIVIMLTAGKCEAFVGYDGNVLWVDNVRLAY